MTTARKLDTHQATVQTATVEVKTLTIGRRQVTLSVFRQLIDTPPLIDVLEGEFNGPPWGRVHYFPPPCNDLADTGHLHVVWQFGGELRRACVDQFDRYLAWERNLLEGEEDLCRALDQACFLYFASNSPGSLCRSFDALACGDRECFFEDDDAGRILARLDLLRGRLADVKPEEWLRHHADSLLMECERHRYSSLLNKNVNPTTTQDLVRLREKIAGRKAILCRRQDAYGRLYGQLRELPQLFIAT